MIWKINLDVGVIGRFRDMVNERPWLFYENYADSKKWNLLCACMDRIEDIVLYLNEKELNDEKFSRSAFDFVEFISQADVLVDCVSKIRGFVDGVDVGAGHHREIFKHKNYSNKYAIGSKSKEELDKKYFKYIRSLSSIHPAGTDHYSKLFQRYDSEVSPFVAWKRILPVSSGDLILKIYKDGKFASSGDCDLYVDEFFNYVKWVYYQLNDVSKFWKEKVRRRLGWYKAYKIRQPSDFSGYGEYLTYLAQRSKKCFYGVCDLLESVKFCIDLNCVGYKNRESCERFCAQLKMAVADLHRKMQAMNISAINDVNLPLEKLLHSGVDERDSGPNGVYYFEKVHELIEGGDTEYARGCIAGLLPFLNRYVDLSDKDCEIMDSNELYLSIMSAKYLYLIDKGRYRERN